MKKKILLGLVAIVVILQFFRIEKTNPAVIAENDFITVHQPNEEVATLLKSACYDCHSYETNYPWYSNIAPISWWLADHIEEGREHLNFSEWGTYSEKKSKHKLHECEEEVEEGEMPLDSYTWTHSEAKLSDEQREMLEDYFKTLALSIQNIK